ncbi:MAG: ribonuclease P protein component [Candidatus Eremiobacteraeota bacterium]|nr:ribonuclease P protein component [Candidatus Eremiobacteraeota bacterium]
MRWFGSLRRQSEIAFVRRRGRRAAFATFVSYGVAGPVAGGCRVGITASKDVGGAVERNRARRRLRGALERVREPRPAGRVLFILRETAAIEPFERLAADAATALSRVLAPGA